MHENRETSVAPAQAGRSEKAKSRKSDMHAAEESDRGVVPVKQPNKEAFASAEVVEGSLRTKENQVQSHTSPTQSGAGVFPGLDRVRQAARERRQERFTNLLHHVSVDLLRQSFFALKRKAAPGVDGVRWQEYETGLEDRLIDLHSRVHRGAYRAQPSKRVYIPKADGRQRPLGIAALEDKIVQQAVVTVLNQILRGRLPGSLLRVPARTQPSSGAGRAACGHRTEAGELDSGCRHQRLLRPYES